MKGTDNTVISTERIRIIKKKKKDTSKRGKKGI